MRLRHTVISTIFFHNILQRQDFRNKKLLNIKCVFRFSLEVLSEIFLILKRTEWDMIKNVYLLFKFRNKKLLGFWVADTKVCIKKLLGSTILIYLPSTKFTAVGSSQELPVFLYCNSRLLCCRVQWKICPQVLLTSVQLSWWITPLNYHYNTLLTFPVTQTQVCLYDAINGPQTLLLSSGVFCWDALSKNKCGDKTGPYNITLTLNPTMF